MKKIERKVFKSFYGEGNREIMIGLIALSFGSGALLIFLLFKMMISGSLIFLIGLWMLIRLLQRYPKTAIPEQLYERK